MNERQPRKHILLVEDSDTQALKTTALLESEGFTVERMESAEDALEYLNAALPDLIIVDYHLPGMDGDQFCRLVRFNPVIEPVPMLILTDDLQPDTERQGLDSGADDHITKSTDPDVLIARIHAVMRKPRSELLPGGAARLHAQRILLIDDSLTYLAFLQHELETEGFQVEAADGGEAALQALNRTAFDCIVVDLVMPGMDGIELCRQIDDFRHSSNLSFPVLMVTGHDSKDEMMRALEAGADDFVSKSNDIAVIKARIRALLRRKMLHDEHERIVTQFRNMELQVLKERSEKEAAQQRLKWAEELELVHKKLELAHAELKETQAQLVQSAKMASIGELVAGIAHEVNNPLAYAMSHLQTVTKLLAGDAAKRAEASEGAATKNLEKASQRVAAAVGGLERVADLMTKLRTFSRLDEGEFKSADMAENIESTLALLSYRLAPDVKVTKRFADDNRLFCAPGALNQAIMNIVANAIDAVGEAGRVSVATERDDGGYRIVVSDNGPGIPNEIRDRVFEPFFTTKDVGQGTGLGLAIAYKIVERHKGSVTIGNRRGGGTRIVVSIPIGLEGEFDAAR